MRFPLAALFFVIGCFIFFCYWVFGSLIVNAVANALPSSNADHIVNMIPWAFGIICAIFFVMGLIAVFVMDSLGDEQEYYYR